MNAEVLLHCTNCGQKLRADMPVVQDEDGDWVFQPRTLNGDWGIRWIKSHLKPTAFILRTERVA